jgi:hypothetical protein
MARQRSYIPSRDGTFLTDYEAKFEAVQNPNRGKAARGLAETRIAVVLLPVSFGRE